MPIPSIPSSSPPQLQAAYSSSFRARTDAGYTTPRLSVPDPDPSLRSGSNDNARLQNDSRRHPVFHQARSGNVPPSIAIPAGEVPYAESVLSVESEDEVHKIAKINAEYNAASSSLYGSSGRGTLSGPEYGPGPSLVPPTSRMAISIAPPRDSTPRQIYTDAPLTSSPTQMRYTDELQRSTSYRENRSSDGRVVYGSSYRTAIPPPRHADEFLPPLKEWDDGKVPPTPWNSPQTTYEYSSTSRSRRTGDRELENSHSRPLPMPPPQPRMYGTSEGAPVAEKVMIVQRSPEAAAKQTLPDDRRGQQRNDVPESSLSQTKQSSSSRRERRSSVSVQAEPSTSVRSPPSSVGVSSSLVAVQYSSDEYDSVDVKRSSSTRTSKDRRRAAAPDDAQRVLENTSSTSPPHEPRFIPKAEASTVPPPDRPQGPLWNSPTPAPVEENRASGSTPGRSSREGESSDREGSSRSKKSSSNYDRSDRGAGPSSSPREERTSEKSKSSRHSQDRAPKEHSSRSSAPPSAPPEYERRRKDSTTQPPPPSEFPIVSPTLVPLARASTSADQMSRSYSRGGGPPIVTVEPQGMYQRPHRRYSDDDRSLSSNGSYSGRRDAPAPSFVPPNQPYSSYTPRPPPTAPEPHRRYSDSDVPPQPPFLKIDTMSRQPSMGGGRRTMPNPRTVRWDDNLICPSPILASQRREGWFNRRGDQLWTNDGMYMPAPAGQEYPSDLEDYPEYGEGWMNEKGVRIDMGHRLIPKTPLRPALKQTQPR
ncbi:hypothetical protein AX14_009061 [Amanita brunnescens Koide BX004]|nr:hypothetical protein AX14_009061 [Amanita brunnescens Koide BX004]